MSYLFVSLLFCYLKFMKKYGLYLFVLLLASCHSKPNSDDLKKINGYWEIEEVVFPDGNKKVYQVNDVIDKFELTNNKGIRTKVKPQLDGTFLNSNLNESVQIIDSNSTYYLKAKTNYATWIEEIEFISKDKLVLEHQNKTVYHYKRFVSLSKHIK